MGTGHAAPFVVRSADQMRALRSPLRQEIIDVVVSSGPRSVAELAGILGRPADALYYHVRRLQRVGLLLRSGRRHTGARLEELVDVPGRPVSLPSRTGAERERDAIQRIVASMLRMTARQHAAALRDAASAPVGGRRRRWASRVSGWLSAAELESMMRTLSRMNTMVQKGEPDERRRLYALTFVVLPLAPSVRRTPRRRGRGSRTRASGTERGRPVALRRIRIGGAG